MKRKNKLIFTCILALVICALLVPCVFAEEGVEEAECGEQVAVEEAVEVAESSEQAVEEIVSEDAVVVEEIIAVEETLEVSVEKPVEETVEEIDEETVDETVEETLEADVPAEEIPVDETIVIPEGGEAAPYIAEEICNPELQGNDSGTCFSAMFYGLNDSAFTLKGGEAIGLGELAASLGYEGEIESAVSSNSEALEIADGMLRVLNPFGDEAITLVIGGREVVIKVHDPAGTPVNADNIVNEFMAGGDFYLESDIHINNGELAVPSGVTVTLDLNGHTLRGDGGGSVITVRGTFTLNDSSANTEHKGYVDVDGLWNLDENGEHILAEGETEESIFGGVIIGGKASYGGGVYNGGTFIMNGGAIRGNRGEFGGGGVYNDADFTMTGGKIFENNCKYGGGVWNTGSFTMTGGEISKNRGSKGSGVYAGAGTAFLSLGGDAKIIDNTEGPRWPNNNLYLCYDITVAIATGDDAPRSGMSIGVKTAGAPTADNPVIVATGAKTGDEVHFKSDVSGFTPIYDSNDDKIKLTVHQHDWSYALSDDKATVTATCAIEPCPVTDTSLTITAPAASYDGLAHGASFVQSSFCGSAVLPEISYKLKSGGTASTDKPKNAGTYVASFTVGTGDKAVTASVEFTIAKATPTASDFEYTSPHDLVYDGDSKTARVTPASGKAGIGNVTVKYFGAGGNEITDPKNAGNYTVKISVDEGDNYLKAELLADDNWKFTVAKATPTADDFSFTPPENTMYDGTDKTAKVEFASDTKTGIGDVTVRYFDADGNLIEKPTNAEDYTVKITVAEGDNFSSVPVLLAKDSWKFTIEKATPTADDFNFIPPKNLVYDGTAKWAVVTPASETKTGLGQLTVRYFDAAGKEISGNGPKDAGTYTVKLSVEEGKNYLKAELLADDNWKFTLAPKQLTVTGTSVEDSKVYDGTDAATVKEAGTLSGFLASDDVELASAAAKFKDANAGKGKTVTVHYDLGGDDAGNYVVPDDASLTADINPLQLSVTGTTVADKTYDGTTDARATVGKVDGILDADLAKVTVTASASFDTPDVGTDKEVTVVYSLKGDSAGNYLAPENDVLMASILEKPVPPVDDAAEGVSVYVDGELLAEGEEYTWVNGKIVFTAEFLETLEEGEHVLKVVFPGFSVEEGFSFTDGALVPAEDAKYLAV